METAISAFINYFNISRQKATVLLSIIVAVISIPATLSFGVLSGFKIADKTIFDALDYITSNILLPFNTLLICILAGWFVKSLWQKLFGNTFWGIVFNIILKFVVPIILICVLVTGL